VRIVVDAARASGGGREKVIIYLTVCGKRDLTRLRCILFGVQLSTM